MSDSKPSSAANIAQIDYWNAAAGTTWANFHDQLDRQVGPLGGEALRALALDAGARVLDIGCGCGQTTIDIAIRVGGRGLACGIDISEPMLVVARNRTIPQGAGAVEFRRLDAQIAALDPARFDAVFSRFGVMFFSDSAAAFANIRTALVARGRLSFVCWRSLAENPWMREPMEAVTHYLPPLLPPNPLAPGPFAFADGARVRNTLIDAGFANIEVRAYDTCIGAGSLDETLQLALRIGPLGTALRETPELTAQVTGPVRSVLERYVTPTGVLMPAAVWIVTATAN